MHCNVFLDDSSSKMFTADEVFDVITSDYVDYVSDYPKKDWEEAVFHAFRPYSTFISWSGEGFRVKLDPDLIRKGGPSPYGFIVQKADIADIASGRLNELYYGETIGEWVSRQLERMEENGEEEINDLVITQVFDCHI